MAELLVDDKPIDFTSGFSDLSVNCAEYAEFKCAVSDPTVVGKWYKDGIEVVAGERIKFVDNECVRKICIYDVQSSDIGEYEYRVTSGRRELSMTACLDAIQLIVEKEKEPPKIYLNLSDSREIVVRAGHKLIVDIPITRDEMERGKLNSSAEDTDKRIRGGTIYLDEEATIEWSRELRGDLDGDGIVDLNEYLPSETIKEFHDHIRIDNAPDKTSLVLNNARRSDAGRYKLFVKADAGDDEMYFHIRVIDIPGPPGKPVISQLTGEDCRVDWNPPLEDGGTHIGGYIIERKKTSSSRWIKLNSYLHEYHNYWARRMIEGSEYEIRVSAVNQCGIGEPSAPSDTFIPQEPTSEVSQFRTGQITDTSIELLWEPPLEIGCAGLDGYKLQYQKLSGKIHDEDSIKPDQWLDAVGDKLIDEDTFQIDMDNLETGKNYMFRICTQNKAGRSKWVYIGPIMCCQSLINPRIKIPKAYRNPGITVRAGDMLQMVIPYEGRPLPDIKWKKKEPPKKGWEFLDAVTEALPDYAMVKNSPFQTIMTIRKASKDDSGTYKLSVQVGDMFVEAPIEVAVIDVPTPVKKLKVDEVIGNSIQLSWEKPADNGNCEITGYKVEKRDKRSGSKCDWFLVHEKIRQTKVMVYDLVPGNEYEFRIQALNECGLGAEAVTPDYTTLPKEPFELKSKVFNPPGLEKIPEFTSPLNARMMIVDYEATLSCSLQGNPRPQVKWMYNKVEINPQNPKYRIMRTNGICQLILRRARFGDGGTYTCFAESRLGTDSVTSEVVVRDPDEKAKRQLKDPILVN